MASRLMAENSEGNSEPVCFPELAPLYALDSLSPEERAWVEQQLLDSNDLAQDMLQQQQALAALAYGTELPAPLADRLPDLKAQLFDRLHLAPPAETPLETPVKTPISDFVPFFSVRSDQVKWIQSPVPKVQVAMLYSNEATREKIGLLKAEAGMVYPRHRHGGTEEIYMLSGDLTLEGVVYHSGDYIRSAPNSIHNEAYSQEGCMFFFRSSMDDDYS